jgi:hypothetical protein
VQEQVGEQRTDDPTLRRALGPLCEGAVPTLDRRTQPPADVKTYPGQIRVMSHGTFNEIMRNGIKEGFDVQIYDPVVFPAAPPCHANRVERRAARPIAVGVRVKQRFHCRLQHHLCDRLRYAIGNGRNAEWTRAALSFSISTSRTGGG